MDVLTTVFRAIFGVAILLSFCYLLSSNRKAINWKLVIGGLALQIILAILILKVPVVYVLFKWIADRFVDLLSFAEAGAEFILGSWPDEAWVQVMDNSKGGEPQAVLHRTGYIFAFKVLPTVIFFSGFTAVLFYLGILQRVIYGFAWVMKRFMPLSGAESIAAAANVFIGQTEAPLLIKPYLEGMTKSEILCLMTGGMATISGGLFALFITLLGEEYAIHFLTASIMSAPAAIVVAKMLYPETEPEKIKTSLEVPKEKLGSNILDAVSLGTTDGVRLAVNVGAMLLVFIALIALVNGMLGWAGDQAGINSMIEISTDGRFSGLTLEYLFGWVFAPVAWLLGVPSEDVLVVGQLLGKKTVINEVVAYVDLSAIQGTASLVKLHPKSVIIATYALCGFSNFASIGIQIGGIGAIAPSQRPVLTVFGIKALIGGTVACFITGAIAGVI